MDLGVINEIIAVAVARFAVSGASQLGACCNCNAEGRVEMENIAADTTNPYR